MREIKFRLFGKNSQEFLGNEPYGLSLKELQNVCELDVWHIMQFTGLTDKNGVEIYEGDIVHYLYKPSEGWSADAVAVISWKGTGFFIKPISGHCLTCWLVSLPGAGESEKNNPLFEVIGNIHSNPELLEQKL